MNELMKDIIFRAGFVGESLNPVFGTCQETALENLIAIVVKECAKYMKETDYNDLDYPNIALEFAADDLLEIFGVK